MLPLQLLRVKITKRGKNISPVFCKYNDEVTLDETLLAADMIEHFKESWRKKETKRSLGERIALLESQCDDYKLVRGLYTLLERRCVFGSGENVTIAPIPRKMNEIISNNRVDAISAIDPVFVRKCLFEESSKRGYALTDFEREEIIATIASRIDQSSDKIVKEMWADLEENMIIKTFDTIEPGILIAWYNLSLMQTLLFNCTKLEFHVRGGLNWKRVLRDVKRLGLMYNLQYKQKDALQQAQKKESNQKYNEDGNDIHGRNLVHSHVGDDNNNIVTCYIDGPLSIFKLTDRYGTSIAKLLPSIIASEEWSLSALIVRNTPSLGKKIYEFEMSKTESPYLLSNPNHDKYHYDSDKNLKERPPFFTPSSSVYFDSSVEEKFAIKFEQSSNGWKLIREPDPLIVATGKGFIPDFAFEKYGRRVYLEIVGFWTNEYLMKKIEKIAYIMSSSSSPSLTSSKHSSSIDKIDFFIAVNMDSYVSGNKVYKEKILASLKLSNYIDKERLIVYKNDIVPIKPILDYLKLIDLEMIEGLANSNYNDLIKELDHIIVNNNNNNIISLRRIAEKYNVPIESVFQVIRAEQEKSKYKNQYIIAETYLIPLTKVKQIELLLRNTTKYSDASLILANNDIPEDCYIDLISKMGYDIVWQSMDSNTATIARQNSK